MEDMLVTVLVEGGAIGLLGLVLFMFNKHFCRMLDNHDEDRRTWLEAIKEITKKLGLIEEDVSDIEEDLTTMKNTLKNIEEKL